MRKKKNHKTENDDRNQIPKKGSKRVVEVEIEKNFFIKTSDPDRVRLEKWQIGRRKFP